MVSSCNLFAAMVALIFMGFVRIGEILSLRTEDLSLEYRYLKVKNGVGKTDQNKQGQKVLYAQTGEGFCAVNFLERQHRAVTVNHDSGPLVGENVPHKKRHRRPIPYNVARAELQYYLNKFGLKKSSFSWHSFRHAEALHGGVRQRCSAARTLCFASTAFRLRAKL